LRPQHRQRQAADHAGPGRTMAIGMLLGLLASAVLVWWRTRGQGPTSRSSAPEHGPEAPRPNETFTFSSHASGSGLTSHLNVRGESRVSLANNEATALSPRRWSQGVSSNRLVDASARPRVARDPSQVVMTSPDRAPHESASPVTSYGTESDGEVRTCP
jgi:hypothetical protein